MKKTIKYTILPAFALAASTMGAHATLLAYDGFETTSGPLNGAGGGSGWAENWVSNSANTLATNSLGTPTNVSSSGGHVSFDNNNGDNAVEYYGAYRKLTTSIDMGSDNTYYISVAMVTTGSWANFGLSTVKSNGKGVENRLMTGYSSGSGKIFGDGWSQQQFINSNAGDSLFAVLKIEATSDNAADDKVSIKFFNDLSASTGPEPTTWDLSLTKQSSDLYDTFGIQRDKNGDSIDEIRIGTTWADVVPEPSSTALLGLGGLVLLFRRRK